MDVQVNIRPDRRLNNDLSVYQVVVPELDVCQVLYLPFDDFHRYFHAPEDIAADLLVVAGIVYLFDQMVSRSYFPDNWTRELSLNVPVSDVARWKSVADDLSRSLMTLTGDSWQLQFAARDIPIYHGRHRKRRHRPLHDSGAICLFSGGLDSLTGAIDYLTTERHPVTLVGHYDLGSSLASVQVRLAEALEREYGRLNFIQARVGRLLAIQSHPGTYSEVRNPTKGENTLRSRSIVFLALGLYVARRFGPERPLLIPENGFIALNPPLTGSRLGSLSTRTTAPLFIEQFQAVVERLGIANPIHNPLLAMSKGEALAQCANTELLHSLTEETVSCAHPTRRAGWYRRQATHCGYCVPCLFRRAALHRLGWDDGRRYGYDVLAGELGLDEEIGADLRAVLAWVHDATNGDRSPQRMVNRMMLPPALSSTAVRVLETGLEEMRTIIHDKASSRLKRWAGLEET